MDLHWVAVNARPLLNLSAMIAMERCDHKRNVEGVGTRLARVSVVSLRIC